MLNIISLGAGVQSTTLALLAAKATIPPLPDCAIFADTGEEPAAVYRHLSRLCGSELLTLPDGRIIAKPGSYQSGVLPFEVHVVAAWDGYGRPNIKASLGTEILNAARGTEKPGSVGTTARGFHSRPPFYTRGEDGSKGMVGRQCTGDYKLEVIERKVRELLGLKRRRRWPKEHRVSQWIGISSDEATRAKPIMVRRPKTLLWPAGMFPHPTIVARWPLLELGWSRSACEDWLRTNWQDRYGFPMPPKSACTFCPFHSNAEWRNIRDTDPAGWSRAIEIDEAIRHRLTSKHLTGALYLHASRKPLAAVDLSEKLDRQINLFENECTGMCGV